MSERVLTIALTAGDPAGIGPEIAVKVAASPRWRNRAKFVIYGEITVIREAARRWSNGEMPEVRSSGDLPFGSFPIGCAEARCGKIAYDNLTMAVEDALSEKVDAIVTAPMNKYAVNLAGIPFTGHTERIAELCGIKDYVMMQSAGNLRMVFVTCHVPLAEVTHLAVKPKIVQVARLLNHAIQAEGIESPKLAMAAINPHAGENGCMGMEDELQTKPAIAELRNSGIDIDGPFPPDTLFIEDIRRNYDGIVAMYHDQGHIPFKMLAFHNGVNSTLGLPIIRCSPDHGTAFDIAWKGVANIGSFQAAVELAICRAERKNAGGNR
ncbi:MAG: 4-hydroxythreonine-4-phosphate dehydrogenase PdxA [Victivallales bacterium]|jgi:4-hydroxythreonine-4-phosphate dehydrogenase|nr:4-hydroxythreonine-4-phosphate dehydrogenase PdxA [Victivallales bacterium]